MDDADAPSRLLVVANRLPIVMKKNSKGVWEFSMSSGGLVAALSALKTSYIWIGWPGTEVPAEDQETVRQKLWDEYKCVPVFLEHKLAEVRSKPQRVVTLQSGSLQRLLERHFVASVPLHRRFPV